MSLIEREFYLGAMRFNVDEDLVFAGEWDEKYLPDGLGTCYFKNFDEVKPCYFQHGKPQAHFEIPEIRLDGVH